jgi:nanoRNase/pAp phosphatase (c-di-AMP/oligoRNAs hydrolase)
MTENRLEALAKVLENQTSVLILPHNDPDPDAIATAVGLRYLLKEKFQVESRIAYQGYIGRAENKALVRYLEIPLHHLQAIDLRSASKIALVDTQPGAGNNALPDNQKASIVIDHHPLQTDQQNADFIDVRSDLGASSTILTDYLLEAGINIHAKLATVLFFGIKTDTRGLSRNTSPSDVKAYLYLQSRIDVNALAMIEQAQVPLAYYRSIYNAIHAGRVFDDDTVIAYIGKLSYPDLGAELADFFMRLKGVKWVLCTGVFRDELILSMRSRSRKNGAGQLISKIIGDIGTAGGHGNMAGGHIKLGKTVDPEKLAADLEISMLTMLKGTYEVENHPLI